MQGFDAACCEKRKEEKKGLGSFVITVQYVLSYVRCHNGDGSGAIQYGSSVPPWMEVKYLTNRTYFLVLV